jgi:hypothetical protein
LPGLIPVNLRRRLYNATGTYKEKEKFVSQKEVGAEGAELRVTGEEARQIAGLLRYAVSLNTTAGLVSPTERRLTTPTYRAMELAAQVLEGKTFCEAAEKSAAAWTGSLAKDYQHALELMQSSQEAIKQIMAQYMQPEQFAQYLEVSQQQFLELVKSGMPGPPELKEPEE